MGDFSRDTFDKLKHYVSVKKHKGIGYAKTRLLSNHLLGIFFVSTLICLFGCSLGDQAVKQLRKSDNSAADLILACNLLYNQARQGQLDDRLKREAIPLLIDLLDDSRKAFFYRNGTKLTPVLSGSLKITHRLSSSGISVAYVAALALREIGDTSAMRDFWHPSMLQSLYAEPIASVTPYVMECGENTIDLSLWWTGLEDQSLVSIDPMGGYIFVYWIDEDGNACHGVPGISGQPGPGVVIAFHMQGYDAASGNATITMEQLQEFRRIPFSLGSYSAQGLHFVQHMNTIWRIREDGDVFQSRASGLFSIPCVASLNSPFCFQPVIAGGHPDCVQSSVLFLPSFLPEAGQHPSKCRVRAMPNETSLSVENLLNYCIIALPDGGQITEY